MLRQEIETLMKSKGQKTITLVYAEDSPLGMHCTLTGGFLHDCWGHRVNRKMNIWGYMKYEQGIAKRIKWES